MCESEACEFCALHCDWHTRRWCKVHWEKPGRCQTDKEWCNHLAPEDCIMQECAKHCTNPNCERHRNPPDRAPSTNRTPGFRSSMKGQSKGNKGVGKTEK